MNKPTILFFGTPSFSAQVLSFLIEHDVSIMGIVTQPDRPKGRSLQVSLSPVKEVAQKMLPNVPIYQPERCSNSDFLQQITALQADLYVVVAFGQILPVKLLEIPPQGCVNVHASLLPKYRGAAPIQRCLIQGETETGIAIQKMVKELDAGDVIVEKKIPIPEDMTYGELEQSLCDLSKSTLLSLIQSYALAIPSAVPQNHAEATLAPKIKPEEGQIFWATDSRVLHNLIRGFSPRPGAWCWIEWNGERKRLKVLKSKICEQQGASGEVLSAKELIVACQNGSLQLLEVQLEGKPKMNGSDWFRGAPKNIKFL